MRLNQHCDATFLDWNWEPMESGIEKSGGYLICLNGPRNGLKPAQIEGSFCLLFDSRVLCGLGLPGHHSVLNSYETIGSRFEVRSAEDAIATPSRKVRDDAQSGGEGYLTVSL